MQVLVRFNRSIAALLLTGVFYPLTAIAQNHPMQSRFLDPGPLADNEISAVQTYIPSEAPIFSQAVQKSENQATIYKNDTGYTSQIFIRREGRALAFRLILAGPNLSLLKKEDDVLLSVLFLGRATDGTSSYANLGYVHASDFKVIDTQRGQGLATDWIWSPYAYHRRKTEWNDQSWQDFDTVWNAAMATMADRRPFMGYRAGTAKSFTLSTIDQKQADLEKRDFAEFLERREQQSRGDAALAAIADPDPIYLAYYGRDYGDYEKRQEVLQWMKANFNPVGPYARMFETCGSMPDYWQPSSRWNPIDFDKSAAQLQVRVNRLNSYADCVERVWNGFDYAAYEALYPAVLAKVAEWQAAGGELVTQDYVPSEGYISGFAHVAPELVDNAFEQRIRQVTLPNSQARVMASEQAQREAQERRLAAEERAERRAAEARQRAAMRQMAMAGAGTRPAVPSFEEIRNTNLQGMMDNARVAAETGDASVLFDANNRVRTQTAPEVAQYDRRTQSPVRDNGREKPTRGASSNSQATDEAGTAPTATPAPAPEVERKHYVYLATTKPLTLVKVGPNHGCLVPRNGVPEDGWGTIDCTEVDSVMLYSVVHNADKRVCPPQLAGVIYGPSKAGYIYKVVNLTEDEYRRAMNFNGDRLVFFRDDPKQGKSELEIRLVDTALPPKPGAIQTHWFRHEYQAAKYLNDLGCEKVQLSN